MKRAEAVLTMVDRHCGHIVHRKPEYFSEWILGHIYLITTRLDRVSETVKRQNHHSHFFSTSIAARAVRSSCSGVMET